MNDTQPKSNKGHFWKNFGMLFGATLLVTYIGIFGKWVQSVHEVTITDLVLPCILGFISSALFALVFYRMYKKNAFAGLVAAFGMALLTGQEYPYRLASAMPFLLAINPFSLYEGNRDVFYNIEFVLLLIILMFAVAFALNALFRLIGNKIQPRQAANTLIIIVAVVFVLKTFSLLRVAIVSWPQYFEKPADSKITVAEGTEKPDIYYLVLEDYANQKVLSEQFGYDNSGFMQFLKSNGFVVDENAKSNYPSSTMSLASTLNMDYETDRIKKFSGARYQNNTPYNRAIFYAKTIQDLKSIGYKYYLLGSWYETSVNAPLADKVYTSQVQLTFLGRTWNLNSFPRTFLGIFQNGLRIGKYKILTYTPVNYYEPSYQMGVLDSLINQKPGGRFIFAHVFSPHEPYVYNPDGSLASESGENNTGKNIKQKYTDQIGFINNQMEYIITKIQQKSNNKAVIVLLSDEGSNPILLSRQIFDVKKQIDLLNHSDMSKYTKAELELKLGTLAAYYIPKADAKIIEQNANSVNAFRIVFNTYFGTNYQYLPNCMYAFAAGKSKPFQYVDITKTLTGETSQYCASQGNIR